ncbi:hypothetical protein T11_13617 [Trichinella zimbabwensis]|uniref:Uncharacterized protein n=1 Tax=Trichinella zimbabwensis TaxID=268475 RepID=A0A0V1G9H7_9BILA|nr:hypothetical protein T11_13617 [Trichinella zimbabwensis]
MKFCQTLSNCVTKCFLRVVELFPILVMCGRW